MTATSSSPLLGHQEGIPRWPARKIKSVDKMIERLATSEIIALQLQVRLYV